MPTKWACPQSWRAHAVGELASPRSGRACEPTQWASLRAHAVGELASPRSGRAWACCSLSEAAPEVFLTSFHRLLVKGLVLADKTSNIISSARSCQGCPQRPILVILGPLLNVPWLPPTSNTIPRPLLNVPRLPPASDTVQRPFLLPRLPPTSDTSCYLVPAPQRAVTAPDL
jgi:hypothetical protein